MRHAEFVRYFLGFRPGRELRDWLAALAAIAGQERGHIFREQLHLTLCVIAEGTAPDPFLIARVHAALAGAALATPVIGLGRLRGGRDGAALQSIGRRAGILDFYARVEALLAAKGLHPLHRESGPHPHITLGHDPLAIDPCDLPVELIPDALLLIESHVGRTRHEVVGRWPLLPPVQGRFDFAELVLPPLPGGPTGVADAA